MGLDMYFTARRSFWDFKDGAEGASKVISLFPELPEGTKTSNLTVSVEFGYWRKANAIHAWFVDNIQEGEDNCQESWVAREDMQALLDTVNKVLADTSLAPELLPTSNGFFFGSTEYNEWYWKDIEYTRDMLTRALNENMKDWDFYYQASW